MPRKRILPCWRSRSNAGTTSSSTWLALNADPPPAQPASGNGDGVVQIKDIALFKLQSREAAFERSRNCLCNAAELAGRHPDLGADDHIGRLQLLQHAAKILFRFAVAVQHRSI